MVEPRLGSLVPPTLEAQVGILTKVRSNFGKPLQFHAVKILLIHQIPKHSHDFNGGNASFDHEDRIGNIYLYLEVVGYELLLSHLNISPQLFAYTTTPNFTSI